MSAQRKRFLSVAMTISLSLGTVIKSQKISEVLFSARGGNYHTSIFCSLLILWCCCKNWQQQINNKIEKTAEIRTSSSYLEPVKHSILVGLQVTTCIWINGKLFLNLSLWRSWNNSVFIARTKITLYSLSKRAWLGVSQLRQFIFTMITGCHKGWVNKRFKVFSQDSGYSIEKNRLTANWMG